MTPKHFRNRNTVAEALAAAEPIEPGATAIESLRLAGRIMARRGHGGIVFLDLVDRTGRIQLVVQDPPEPVQQLALGDVVGVAGSPMRTKRGEPSLSVAELEPLAKIHSPLPDTFHGLTDVEQRYRRRHLDLLMNEETRADFLLRTAIVSALRRGLDEEGFVEVETPVLQPRYGGAFARPFETRSNELDQTLYLRIATELYLKRLIVGGLERVYEIGKDFRNEGVSYKHNPEFTMLEWYEAYADYRDTMDRMERLVARVTEGTIGRTETQFRGHSIDFSRWQRVKLTDALDADGLWTRDEAELRARLNERAVDTSHDRTWAQLIDHALSHFVEPHLIQPTILYDYPVELSPFARMADEEGIVERFEYYAGGMELGNAFTEINDAEEQSARFALQVEEGAGGNIEAEPGDPDYVEALSYGMPPTGGLGMGIDRLAMLLLGKDSIRDVVLFPALRDVARRASETPPEGR
jgi:lysyl-tRNA synthetase class 2